jgi:hypothetical protein
MEEALIQGDLMFITHEQSAKVAQPSEGAFDLPAIAVAAQSAPVVERGFAPPPTMRTDEQDAALEQSPNHLRNQSILGSSPLL